MAMLSRWVGALCGLVMLAPLLGARAAPVASLQMNVAGASNSPIIGACSSQSSGPILAPDQSSYGLALTNVGAGVTTRPVPGVSASITGAVVCPSAASASVRYFVQVDGTPGTQVPVDFSGLLSLATPRMLTTTGFSGTTQVENTLLLTLRSQRDGDFMGLLGLFDATRFDGSSGTLGGEGSAYFGADLASGRGRIQAHLDGIGTLGSESGPAYYDTGPTPFLFSNDFTGSFDGTFVLDIDDTGEGLLQVDMSVMLSSSNLIDVGAMRGYLDPSFSISADFLAANPGTRLQVLGGFGNEATAVPAPGTGSLALLALVLVLATRPQRRSAR